MNVTRGIVGGNSISMRLARILLIAHFTALGFGLGGLLIALPHPELWVESPAAARVFDFGMRYAGSLHIMLGAAAMFAFGVALLGWRRTGIFFLASTALSLGAELLGTTSGLPFGDYAYTNFLGYKLFGHVPFSIPLSWFYLGFAAYLLGERLAGQFQRSRRPVWGVVFGVWLLVVWDLVLDPAMAHTEMPVRFWIWEETGAYLGMPLKNFGGWALTGLPFMAVSRLLWRRDAAITADHMWFPFAVYASNVGFAIALSASVGLWVPIILAVLLGLVPASLVLVRTTHASLASNQRTSPVLPPT